MMGRKYASTKQAQVGFSLLIVQHMLSMRISKLERVQWQGTLGFVSITSIKCFLLDFHFCDFFF